MEQGEKQPDNLFHIFSRFRYSNWHMPTTTSNKMTVKFRLSSHGSRLRGYAEAFWFSTPFGAQTERSWPINSRGQKSWDSYTKHTNTVVDSPPLIQFWFQESFITWIIVIAVNVFWKKKGAKGVRHDTTENWLWVSFNTSGEIEVILDGIDRGPVQSPVVQSREAGLS